MKNKIRHLYRTTLLTLNEIAIELSCSYDWVFKVVKASFSLEERKKRKQENYRLSKQGKKNPMFGNFKEKHPNYIGEVPDGKGYLLELKPSWYTGRRGSKHIFVHHRVLCESIGITEIPLGYVVHHIDGDKTNNKIENLFLISLSEHIKLHWKDGSYDNRRGI